LFLQFFFINLPLKLFNFNFILFFPKINILILNLEEKIWLDRRKKYIPTWHFHSIIIYLPFSQYNHIQNFEENFFFQHFANLIKIRSTHLLPILDLIIPPLPEGGRGYIVLPLYVRPSKIFFVAFFSATIGGVVEKNVHICSMCIQTNLVGKQEVGIWWF
jgi:hypothetical protein